MESSSSKTFFGLDLTSIGALLSVAILGIAAFGILSLSMGSIDFQREIRSSGNIYTEEGLGISRESIDWGILEPNQTAAENLTVTNLEKQFIILQFETVNWDPVNASDFIIFSWNYSDEILAPHKSVDLELYLFVDPEISGISNFSFDILLSADQV